MINISYLVPNHSQTPSPKKTQSKPNKFNQTHSRHGQAQELWTLVYGLGTYFDNNILETFSCGYFIVLPSPCKDGDIAFYNKSDLTFVTIEYRSSRNVSLASQDFNLVP